MRRVKIISVVVSVILASCGPVTPIPFSVATSTQSLPIYTQSVTATPTSIVTLQPRASDYQLQTWIADDVCYSNLVDEFNKHFYTVGVNNDHERYELVYQAEKLLRDPSNDWRDIAWDIVADHPKGIPLPGMRPGEDLFAFLIEDLLNGQNVELDELIPIIEQKISIPWKCSRAEIVESLSKQGDFLVLENLFGDNQDGLVFYAGGCQGVVVYALRRVDNQYRVEKLRDWQALEIPAAGFVLQLDTVGDVNNNRTVEVSIDVLFGASGMPPGRGESIEFYEWDPSKESFVVDSVKISENVCYIYEPCENGWRIEQKNTQGLHPIVVNELYATMYEKIEGRPVCDNLIIEHTYLWKNAKFIEQQEILVPATDKRIECQLSWALQVLNRSTDQYDVAIKTISEALSNWPIAMNHMWGPASRDYFALRLGLSYDFIGEEDAALKLIQNVAEQPTNPEFDFLSQLASTYLDVRSKQGRLQACQEINLLQAESEHEISPPYSIYVPVEKLRELWGFGAPIWMHRVDDVCNGKLALELLAKQAQVSKFNGIDTWFDTIGLKPIAILPINESNLPIDVWLVSLPTQPSPFSQDGTALDEYDYREIWLFVKSPWGFAVSYLDDISNNIDATLLVDYFQADRGNLFVLFQANDDDFQRVFLLRIDSKGKIQSLFNSFFAEGFVNRAASEITIIEKVYYGEQPNIIVYKWDSELQNLDARKTNFDFVKAQDEAERLIFQEHDFLRAVLYINEFLIQAPPEPKIVRSCSLGDCTHYPDWYRQYMRYLLAFAYEMLGQMPQARDAYFALWQDYPTSILGLYSEHRLTPKP
jgi:hypothetical protein